MRAELKALRAGTDAKTREVIDEILTWDQVYYVPKLQRHIDNYMAGVTERDAANRGR